MADVHPPNSCGDPISSVAPRVSAHHASPPRAHRWENGVQHVQVEPDSEFSEERPRSDSKESMGANGEGASGGEGVEVV